MLQPFTAKKGCVLVCMSWSVMAESGIKYFQQQFCTEELERDYRNMVCKGQILEVVTDWSQIPEAPSDSKKNGYKANNCAGMVTFPSRFRSVGCIHHRWIGPHYGSDFFSVFLYWKFYLLINKQKPSPGCSKHFSFKQTNKIHSDNKH